jgi:serine-type D-Ala-D-Ala carboxypeptidase/endopeptidase (penicillin-binding protein 4)
VPCTLASLLASVALLTVALPAGAADATRAELVRRLDAALAAPGLGGAGIAALVVDAKGETLYARSPDRPLIPASNLKVLTALAALNAWGPTHRFSTQILADAAPDADGGIGTLYVRGGGDPALTSESLWRLAADLRRAGLRAVRAGIVIDDRYFDAVRWHPSWGRTSARAYHAPVGALTVNYGAFTVRLDAGARPGEPVSVQIDPPVAYLSLSNRARTGGARGRVPWQIDRRSSADGEEVMVSGDVPAGRFGEVHHRSVLDPGRYAGAVLAAQLQAVGVEVAGGVRRGLVPDDAVRLLDFQGPSLSEAVQSFLKYSNNQIGEALVKGLGARASGAPGSWESGTAAVRAELAALGLPLDSLVLIDGSGLSYENRVAPRLLVEALRLARDDFRFGPEFEAALPIGAADGTLQRRAEAVGSRVRAKTGLLTRVTGLSGYALGPDGERVAFCVLVNGFRRSAREAMDAVDGFVAALVRPD